MKQDIDATPELLVQNPKLRESFIELAIKTFDLPFEAWYQSGYWTDKYIPYTMIVVYQCTMPINAKTGTVKKLDMSNDEDRTFLKK